ncbi:hypothetical protein GLYMA_05G223200v4 [Glycine max]|uniref:uncharacterized protein isoform X2 n=1 Tax=Glycine max TaxID=3847 RepID=UPI00023396AD|nr:uncharacterized protein LOC100799050 isoform X2 [Glycine max]KAG4391631.1 hypothetical protein GLYMA_05G223200v4 [Glycine max]KAH1135771.1 hypothetical protein GYH30_013475 [Glycine max]
MFLLSVTVISKTALTLAVPRIKLLKNKREANVKQLRRELAQLLHSGHNHAARVRVEHVVKEEKTMAAYDLIKIYCDLIAARMPMIESQRNCPIDLKEAISSVIFASPRCSDIPELVVVKKHIMAKYGREFVSAAVELRPDCGVNRLLVEKLSTSAPDGPTKIRILTAIAEEHNVQWQPSLEENHVNASQDFLAGPNTLENGKPPQVQLHAPPVGDEKGPPNLRAYASYQLKEMHNISYEKSASLNSSGTGSQEMNFGNLYSENTSSFQMGRQNWNIEFKDATSAAHAAAESAERASMAARAAAELSSRGKLTRQCSSEWLSSSVGELPQKYAFHATEHLSAGYVNSTFRRSSFEIHNEQANVREQHNQVGSTNEHRTNSNENVAKLYQSASLTSHNAFREDKPFGNVYGVADIYPNDDNPQANQKSSTWDSNAHFYSDTSRSEDGLPKRNSVTLAGSASGLSRRMLAPSKTGTCLILKDDSLSKASKTSGASSGHGSAEHAASKPNSEPKSEEIIILSAMVQASSSLTTTMTPDKEEASKSLNSNQDIPSKEKASHVHPKLPDYDTFAAQFLPRKKGLQ